MNSTTMSPSRPGTLLHPVPLNRRNRPALRKLENAYFRNLLTEYHQLYSGKKSKVQIKSNETLLNSEDTLLDWLNSYEFHRNEDKRKFIESLHQMLPMDVSKVIFSATVT